MLVRVRILVSGIVQGVYFRYNAMRKAHELGVRGWVRNRRDGKVEVLCEGPEDDVKMMINWCKKGPEGSVVTATELMWEDYSGELDTFQVSYD